MRHVPILGETVQHAGLGQGGFAQQLQGIGARLPGVHDDRLAGPARCLEMQAKGFALAWRSIRFVVIVQPGLADRHHTRVRQFGEQPIERRLLVGLQIQRVNTYGAVDISVALGDRLDRGGIVGADADTEKMPDATVARRLQGGIERAVMLRQVESIEVAMGIYEH